MSVSLSTVSTSAVKKVVDVTATADADTAAVIPHGMASTPKEVTLTALLDVAITARWFVASIDGTNVNLTKTNVASSSNASPQLRVVIGLPHSLVG